MFDNLVVLEWEMGRFQKDFGLGPLKEEFLDIFRLSLNQNASVAECWDNDHGSWNLSIRRSIFDKEIQSWLGLTTKLEGLHLGVGVDKLGWSLESLGSFSTISMFLRLSEI